jgi:hypothetical protein
VSAARDAGGRSGLASLTVASGLDDQAWRDAVLDARLLPAGIDPAPDGRPPLPELREFLRTERDVAAFAASLI